MNKPRLTIEIDEKLKQEAKGRAYGEGKTLKEKVEELLNTWLRAEKIN